MWLIFAALSIISAGISLHHAGKGKNYKPFMALALSFTALTDCAHYSMIGSWAAAEDISAILDVAPLTSKMLWVFTLVMIFVNILPAFLYKK